MSDQFQRFSSLALPFVALLELDVVWLNWHRCCHGVWQRHDYGVAFLVLSCLAVLFGMARHRLAAAALLTSGWCWALVVRGSRAFHDFEILFMVGAPLAFYTALGTLVRLCIPKPYVLFGLALASAGAFAFSAYEMAKVGHLTEDLRGAVASGHEFHRATVSDVTSVRKLMPEGSSVCVSNSLGHSYTLKESAIKFFFSRRVVTIAAWCGGGDDEYLIVRGLAPLGERPNTTLLTPENQLIFLYRRL